MALVCVSLLTPGKSLSIQYLCVCQEVIRSWHFGMQELTQSNFIYLGSNHMLRSFMFLSLLKLAPNLT